MSVVIYRVKMDVGRNLNGVGVRTEPDMHEGAHLLPERRPRTRALRLAAAALVGSFTLAGCGSKQQDVRLEPPLVAVTRVKPAGLNAVSFTGFISARVESDLGFRVAGKVVERLVDAGVTVRSGQPLMRIDQTDYALSLVAQVQAVNAARAKSVQASADEERYRKLIGTGAISTQTYEQAKAGADSARAELSAAEAQEAVVKNQAEYSVLKADAGGIIMQTLAEPGQVVSAGQVVVKLAHTGPREAIIYLPENVRPAIGSLAMFTLHSSSSKISWAHLRQLSDAADPQSRTYEARYVLEGDAARAPLGATLTVLIPATKPHPLSEVPLA